MSEYLGMLEICKAQGSQGVSEGGALMTEKCKESKWKRLDRK